MAGNEGKNFEVGLHGINDIFGTPLWRPRRIPHFISVADQAEPQATFFQMAVHVFSKLFPLFIGFEYVKQSPIKHEPERRSLNLARDEIAHDEATFGMAL